jgi:predicted RNA-binding protein with PUA-like domain
MLNALLKRVIRLLRSAAVPGELATKADKKFADMTLVKYSRLSVQPVTPDEWKIVCKMGGA